MVRHGAIVALVLAAVLSVVCGYAGLNLYWYRRRQLRRARGVSMLGLSSPHKLRAGVIADVHAMANALVPVITEQDEEDAAAMAAADALLKSVAAAADAARVREDGEQKGGAAAAETARAATNAELALMTDDELEAYSLGQGLPPRLVTARGASGTAAAATTPRHRGGAEASPMAMDGYAAGADEAVKDTEEEAAEEEEAEEVLEALPARAGISRGEAVSGKHGPLRKSESVWYDSQGVTPRHVHATHMHGAHPHAW
jgi:hypothetical protein